MCVPTGFVPFPARPALGSTAATTGRTAAHWRVPAALDAYTIQITHGNVHKTIQDRQLGQGRRYRSCNCSGTGKAATQKATHSQAGRDTQLLVESQNNKAPRACKAGRQEVKTNFVSCGEFLSCVPCSRRLLQRFAAGPSSSARRAYSGGAPPGIAPPASPSRMRATMRWYCPRFSRRSRSDAWDGQGGGQAGSGGQGGAAGRGCSRGGLQGTRIHPGML